MQACRNRWAPGRETMTPARRSARVAMAVTADPPQSMQWAAGLAQALGTSNAAPDSTTTSSPGTFVQLARRLGLRGPVGTRGVSLHKLRHSFAVGRLAAWSQQGVVVRDRLPALAVYLGHVSPQNTYWYLTATPPVLEPAAARFEAFVDGKGAP